MLRRTTKRNQHQSEETDSGESGGRSLVLPGRAKRPHPSDTSRPLGASETKDDVEEVLEGLVFGGEAKITDTLQEEHQKQAAPKKEGLVQRRAVWEDEDDDDIRVPADHVQHPHKRKKKGGDTISGEQYKRALQSQFEKRSGSQDWATLDQQKKSEEESDDDELLQTTSDYLAGSASLPSSVIQIRQCADANKQERSKGKLTSLAFHPTAQVIMTSSMDHTIALFQVDGKTNPKIQSIYLDKFPVYTARFSADGREVIAGSKHKSFYYYDMIAGKITKVPPIKGIEENNMKRFEVSPDGKLIAFMGHYGYIHLISAQSKEWISSLKMNGTVDALTFSQDGSKMYSVGDDGEVYVWDMSSRRCVHKFVEDGCTRGLSIAASPNNQYIACGSYSGVVNIYDQSCMESKYPKPQKSFLNLTTPCNLLKFNHTSEMLAMASNYTERAVRLAHFPSMTVFSNFPDKSSVVKIPYCIDFSVNSGYFSLGDHKGTAMLYRVSHYKDY